MHCNYTGSVSRAYCEYKVCVPGASEEQEQQLHECVFRNIVAFTASLLLAGSRSDLILLLQ